MTELWERFSYYGMRALLMLFMTAPAIDGGLGLPVADAAIIYGNYTMAVYMLSIAGGAIADTLLGARRAVLIGGAVIAAGHYTLAIPGQGSFYAGLLLIVLGTGLFKPSISALVGGLYAKDDPRRDAGFSIFYMGINIGALIAPLVTGFLAQSQTVRQALGAAGFDPGFAWHLGFAAAGIGMTLGLVSLLRRLAEVGEAGEAPLKVAPHTMARLVAVIAGTAALLALVLLSDREGFEGLRWAFIGAPVAAALWLGFSANVEARRLGAVCVLFTAAMIFFAIFEQAGVTLTIFAAEQTRAEIAGLPFPSAWFQALNALFVIVLVPVFAWMWMRLGPRQPAAPVKFAIGLAFLAASFLLMVPAAALTADGKVSPLWLVGLYLLQTIGELFLSPVGLSTMTKLAPVRMTGLVLGIWFLGAALGNKLAGVLGSSYTPDNAAALANYFLWQAGCVAAAAAVLFALAPWVTRLMSGVR